MADRDILDALLRMEATNREDHQLIQTQIRGYAAMTIKLEGDVDALAGLMGERNEACLRRHKRIHHVSWVIVGIFATAVVTGIGFLLSNLLSHA